MFEYARKIHVYETDLMGIVHHSNYLRLCEEARVEWCTQNGLLDSSDESVFGLTVVETKVQHVKPAKYGDQTKISVQVRKKGARLFFQYLIHANGSLLCRAETVHCSLDKDMKVKRLDPRLDGILKEEKWTETWL